jgi:hypothetical protein
MVSILYGFFINLSGLHLNSFVELSTWIFLAFIQISHMEIKFSHCSLRCFIQRDIFNETSKVISSNTTRKGAFVSFPWDDVMRCIYIWTDNGKMLPCYYKFDRSNILPFHVEISFHWFEYAFQQWCVSSLVAVQMWCLARFLPLIIGTLVPENDDHWLLFLKLLHITYIVFSTTISSNQVAYTSKF